MLCVYCGVNERLEDSEVCLSCKEANYQDIHKKAIVRKELLSGLDPLNWKKYVIDGASWTIMCQGCSQEYRVTLEALKSRPSRRRSYCEDCIEEGEDRPSIADYRYLTPVSINYDLAPKLALFLSKRDGNFPVAKNYVKERGLQNV